MAGPTITALRTEDPRAVPAMRKSRPNACFEKPNGAGVIIYFHENPRESQLPTDTREFKDLLAKVKPEAYEPPQRGGKNAERPRVRSGEAKEGEGEGKPKASPRKRSSGKSSGKKAGKK